MPTIATGLLSFHRRVRGRWRAIIGTDIGEGGGGGGPTPPPSTLSPPTFVAAGVYRDALAQSRYVTWPAGHATNDIGLLFVEQPNYVTTPQQLNILEGFAEIPLSPQGTGTAGSTAATRLAVFWCRATSSNMLSPRIAPNPGKVEHVGGVILAFRGCTKTGLPYDVTAGGVVTPASTAISIPGTTTTVDQTLIVAALAWATDSAAGQASGFADTALTSVTERFDEGSDLGNGGGITVVTGIKAAAGAYGPITGTLATASVQAALSLALIPDSGGSGGDGGGGTPPPTTPPPVTTSFRTMIGVWGLGGNPPNASWGVIPTPDTVFSDTNGKNYVGTGGYIAAARLAGAKFMPKVTGGIATSVADDPVTVVSSAPASLNATTIAVQALSGPITLSPSGRTVGLPFFFSPSGKVVATLTQSAPKDATILHVQALSGAIPSGAIAQYQGQYFSVDLWNAAFDKWATGIESVTGGLTELRQAVRDGIIPGLMGLDDYIQASPTHYRAAVTYEEIEAISRHAKTRYGFLPITGRGRNTYHRDTAKGRKYKYFDGGWAQVRAYDTPTGTTFATYAANYYSGQVNAGLACDLGTVGGANILATGQGKDAMGCIYLGGAKTNCAFSPEELKTAGLAAMGNQHIAGWIPWAWRYSNSSPHTWFDRTDIQAAFDDVWDAAKARGNDAAINVRGDLEVVP